MAGRIYFILFLLGLVSPITLQASTSYVLKDAKDSFLSYKPDWQALTNKAVLLKFKTKVSQAALLEIDYLPVDSAKPATNFKVKIEDGFLEYTRQTESRIHSARSETRVSDNQWHTLGIVIAGEPRFRLDDSVEQTLPLSSGDLDDEGSYTVRIGGADHSSFAGCSSVQFLNQEGVYEEIPNVQLGEVTVDQNNCADTLSGDELAVSLTSGEAGFSVPSTSRFQGVRLEFKVPANIYTDSEPKVLLSAGLHTPTGDGLLQVVLNDELSVQIQLPGEQNQIIRSVKGNLEDGKWHNLILLAVPSNRRRRQADDAVVEKDNLIESEATTEAAPQETTVVAEQPVATELALIVTESDVSVTPEESTETTEIIATDSQSTETPEVNADPDRNRLLAPPITRSRLILVLDRNQVELTDDSISAQFKGDIRIGSTGSMQGFAGCIRNISIDQSPAVDLNSVIDPKPELLKIGQCLATGCAVSNPCKHGGNCVDSEHGVSCICTNTGYSGKLCTLPLLMESCANLFLAGERRSGVHLVDIDGNGPRHVYCSMNATESKGTTTISHNLPSVELKSYSLGGARYELKYRNMDQTALKRLVESSEDCRQSVSFKCRNTPLKMGTHTWFRSIHDANVTNFGSAAVKNCDVNDNVDRVDEGYITGKRNVPVSSINILNRDSKGKGVLTIGPLECQGKPGAQEAISFMSKNSYLRLPTLKPQENFQFYFKTFLHKASLLHQGTALRVDLKNDSCVSLYLNLGGEEQSVSACVPKLLNNGGWHLVKVQFGFREVRLTVDLVGNYHSWNFGQKLQPFTGFLTFGAYEPDTRSALSEPGVIGCIKGFARGSQPVDISAAANNQNSEGIGRDCVETCKPDTCQNNAECFDKFGDFDCICSNPVAHSGKNCEININTNPVTFGNASASYIQYQAVPAQILNESILLSFRTHAPGGLLFYSHDNLNNFIQLHLQDGNRVIVTFNLLNRIQRLAVNREGLSDGKWHQVRLAHTENSVSLEVDFEYKSAMKLSGGYVLLNRYTPRPWPLSDKALETVLPPRPNFATVAFQVLYVGGVKRPEYSSSIQGFHGCIRGVKIGDHLLDLSDPGPDAEGDRERDPGVTDGCQAGCELANPCSNGGQCINKWGDQESPAECRCESTSFGGPTCSEDIGASFDGSSRLVVEYKPGPTVFALDLARSMRFRLAFSTSTVPNTSVALLFVQFSQRAAELVFSLTPEGFVKFDLYSEPSNHFSQLVEGNFTNGQRHHLVLTTAGRSVTFQVDDNVKTVDLPFDLSPAFAHYITVGGIDVPTRKETLSEFGLYVGCLSNVVIDSPNQRSSVLEPLKLGLRNEDLPFTGHRFTGENLQEGQCAAFAVKIQDLDLPDNELPTTGLSFPPWDVAPATAEEYQVAAPKPYTPPLERNTGIIVGVVCGLFLLAVIIAVLVYMCRLRSARRNKYDVDREQREFLPENDKLLTPADIKNPENLKLSPSRQVPDALNNNTAAYNPRVTRYIEQD